MKEATAQDKIQALISQYETGQKKITPSDVPVIEMLKPLVKKKYADDPIKSLNAVIVDLSAILKIKYTETIARKGLKKITTLTPDVLGGNITPGIHGDIEALVTELKQKLNEITERAAVPAKNNDAELAEAKRQAAEAAAELAAVKRRAADAEAALAAEKAKPQQPVINSQTEAALAEAKKHAEAAAAALAAEKKKGKEERERLRAERKAAKEEAKAKAAEAQKAEEKLKITEAEANAAKMTAAEAKTTAAKTKAEFQEYKAGEEQRLQQATIDGATQVIRRVAQVVSTNDVMLLAITQGFGGMQEFTNALITGNTTAPRANGNDQLANSNYSQQPAVVAASSSAPNGNHQRVISEAEKQKYKDNLGETRSNIIISSLLPLFDKTKSKNEQQMIRYLITQLAFHIDNSFQSITSETSALFHKKLIMLAKEHPEFNDVLNFLSENSQNEDKRLAPTALTQETCRFMVKRLSGKPENGVLLLPTDEAAVKLFSACYKILGSDKKTIPPSLENTYRETMMGSLELPKPSSPIHARKENAAAAVASSAPNHLTEVKLNSQGL